MRFSIIVPVYNVGEYLNKCVESILCQTYQNFELILVDDGSTDNSPQICDFYEKKDSRIKVIHKSNGGLSSARNEGIKSSIGDYIIFIDSDDYWSNDSFLRCVNENIDEDEKKSIVAWSFEKVTTDNYIYKDVASIRQYRLDNDYKELIKTGKIFASAWFIAISRCLFNNNSLFFEENVKSEDVEWFARLLNIVESINYIDGKYYAYRQRENSISNITNKKTIDDLKSHINKIKNMQPSKIINVYLAEQVCNFYIVLSHYSNYKLEINYAKQIYPLTSFSVRRRSKLIHFFIKIFGIKFAINLLQILRMVSR